MLFITVIAVLILVFSTAALAHPGGTDKYGGHTDHSTGQYHYHHGHEGVAILAVWHCMYVGMSDLAKSSFTTVQF